MPQLYLRYNYRYGLAPVARFAPRIEVADSDVFGSGQLVGCIVACVLQPLNPF